MDMMIHIYSFFLSITLLVTLFYLGCASIFDVQVNTNIRLLSPRDGSHNPNAVEQVNDENKELMHHVLS